MSLVILGGISSSKAKIYHCKTVVGVLKLEDDVYMSFLLLPVFSIREIFLFLGQGSRYKVLFFLWMLQVLRSLIREPLVKQAVWTILFQPAAMLWKNNLETPIQLKVHWLGCIPYEHWYVYSVIHVNWYKTSTVVSTTIILLYFRLLRILCLKTCSKHYERGNQYTLETYYYILTGVALTCMHSVLNFSACILFDKRDSVEIFTKMTRWWFQTFFIFTPI